MLPLRLQSTLKNVPAHSKIVKGCALHVRLLGAGPVPGVVSAFASFAPEVISGLPHIYNYSDGVSGTCTQVTYSCINDIYVRSAGVSG